MDENQRLAPASAKLRVNFVAEPGLREDVNAAQRFEYAGE